MDLLERAKQKAEDSKKSVKIVEVNNSSTKKTPEKKIPPETKKIVETIDTKITNIVNERLLKLANLGLQHELTLENVKRYLKTHKNKTKLYKLADYFDNADLSDIQELLDFLLKTGDITRNKDGWYSLK